MSSTLLNTLHDGYRRDFEAAKSLVAQAAAENRDLTAEEEARYTALNGAMDSKIAKIDDIKKSEDRANKIADLAGAIEVATGKTVDNDADLLRAVLTGEIRSAKFDTRALATATATTPVTFADFVVEALVEGNPVYDGATKVRTSDIRNITVPVVAGTAPAATFVGQGGTIAAADPVFSSITLGAFNAATLTLASRELVDSAGFNLVEYVGRAAGRQIAALAGSAMTIGTGTVEPLGFVSALVNASKTTTAVKGGTAAIAATFFDATDLASALYALAPSYRNPNTVWHVATSAMSKLRKIQDTTGQFLLQPSLAAGAPETLLGYRVKENVYMAAVGSASKSVAIIHEPSYYVREAGGVEVAQSADRYFELNSIGIRTMYHVDGNLPDTNAGRVLVSANT
jgi:HK97 family phage major capsid protein